MIKVDTKRMSKDCSSINIAIAGKPGECLIEMSSIVLEVVKKLAALKEKSPYEILCLLQAMVATDLSEEEYKK